MSVVQPGGHGLPFGRGHINFLHMHKLRYLPMIAALLVFLLVGCQKGEATSVVLVTVDGLSPRQASQLAVFDEEPASFEDALTPSPSTLPAMATVMTGMHPFTHGVKGNSDWRLTGAAVTLAEVFQTNEWRTAAVVGVSNLGPETGLEQGFDTYKWDFGSVPAGPFASAKVEPAKEVTDKALGWVNLFGDKPFFLWVHYGDLARDWASPEVDREEKPEALSSNIKRLMAGLPGKGEKSLVIITAPAANAAGAHGERGHGTLVHNSTVRAPLLVKGPAIKPRKLKFPASLEDIVPTVVSLLNFRQPPEITGRDLAPALRGGRGPGEGRWRLITANEPFYVWNLSPLTAVVEDGYKLIRVGEGEYELYNLKSDPGEEENIFKAGKEPAPGLMKRLESPGERLAGRKNYAKTLMPVEEPEEGLPSPMEKIESLQLFAEAASLYRENKLPEAFNELKKARRIYPGNKRVAVALATIADEILPVPRRVDLWSAARKLNPKDPMVLTSLAQTYYEAGSSNSAMVLLNDALARESENVTARKLAARILEEKALLARGENKVNILKKALQHRIKVIRSDRENPEAYYRFSGIALNMVQALNSLPEKNQPDKDKREIVINSYERAARGALQNALELDPEYAPAHLALGKLLMDKDEKDEAKRHLKKYLELEPEGSGAAEAEKLPEAE